MLPCQEPQHLPNMSTPPLRGTGRLPNSRTPWNRPWSTPSPSRRSARDVSQHHGVWCHPLRYERLRLDAVESDVPPFGEMR